MQVDFNCKGIYSGRRLQEALFEEYYADTERRIRNAGVRRIVNLLFTSVTNVLQCAEHCTQHAKAAGDRADAFYGHHAQVRLGFELNGYTSARCVVAVMMRPSKMWMTTMIWSLLLHCGSK
jgi:hypothetical protein